MSVLDRFRFNKRRKADSDRASLEPLGVVKGTRSRLLRDCFRRKGAILLGLLVAFIFVTILIVRLFSRTDGAEVSQASKHATEVRSLIRKKPPPHVKSVLPPNQTLSPTIAFVTYGDFKYFHFDMYINDALTTYLANTTNHKLFVVLNEAHRAIFQNKCNETCKQKVTPLWVECPEHHFGESPCCKQDQGLTKIWLNHTEKFHWYVYYTGSTYFRTRYLEEFLRGIDPFGQPFVLTPRHRRPLGITWGEPSLKTRCSMRTDYKYPWGEPAIYNQAALNRLVTSSFSKHALQLQCAEFHVSHDAGSSIVHWMNELPQIGLPAISTMPPKPLTSTQVKHLIAIQSVGVLRFNAPDMLEIHNVVSEKDDNYPHGPYDYIIHHPLGYHETSTCDTYGTPPKWKGIWHTLPVIDCKRADDPPIYEESQNNDVFALLKTQAQTIEVPPDKAGSVRKTETKSQKTEAPTNIKAQLWEYLDIIIIGLVALEMLSRGRRQYTNDG